MKLKNKLFILLILVMIPRAVFAAPSGSLSCRAASSVSVGDTVTVTISGSANEEVLWDVTTYSNDESKLKGSNHDISTDFSTSTSYTYKFKAVDEGTVTVSSNASIANITGEKGNLSASCSIKVGGKTETKKEEVKEKNSDNSLKNLEIEGQKLNPEFNSDTLEYNVVVLSDEKTSIKITAEANDKKAKIDGTGEKEVDTGLNKFEVNVTAENGSVRTYILNVTVSDKNPIIIKIDGKKYKLVRKIDGIEAPEGYEKKVIKINGKEVESYYSSVTGYTLVALIDSENKTSLFIYNKGKYTRYSEFTNSSIRLILLTPKKSEVPYKYKKCSFSVDKKTVDGYELSKNSKFKLVYALNLDTNEKAFYLYDLDEKTFQRFYNEQVLIYIGLVKKFKMGLVVIGGIFLIMLVSIVCLVVANKKTTKNIQKITKVDKNKKTMIDE